MNNSKMKDNKYAEKMPPPLYEIDMNNDEQVLDYIAYKMDFSHYEEKAVRKKINFKATLKKNLAEEHVSNQTIFYDAMKNEIKIRQRSLLEVRRLKQQIRDKDKEIERMDSMINQAKDKNHKEIEEKYKIMKSGYSNMQKHMINYNHFIDFIKEDKSVMWQFQEYLHNKTGEIPYTSGFMKDDHRAEEDEKVDGELLY